MLRNKFEEAAELDPKAARPVHRLADIAYWNRRDIPESKSSGRGQLSSSRATGGCSAATRITGSPAMTSRRRLSSTRKPSISPRMTRASTSGVATVSQFRGDYTLASTQRAKRARSERLRSISGLGFMRASQGKLGDAETLLKRAIVLDPKNSLPLAYLAETYAMGKKFSDAVSAYEQALALDPSVPTLHMGLGLVLARKGDLKGALEPNAESDRSGSSEWSFPRKHSLRPHQHG